MSHSSNNEIASHVLFIAPGELRRSRVLLSSLHVTSMPTQIETNSPYTLILKTDLKSLVPRTHISSFTFFLVSDLCMHIKYVTGDKSPIQQPRLPLLSPE